MASFQTTRWTEIQEAAGGNAAALDAICNCYRTAMIAHLVYRWRFDHDTAEDHVHNFLLHLLTHRQWFEKADRNRGRFRSYLLTCLDNFVRASMRKKSLGITLDLDPRGSDSDRDAATHAEPDVFDQCWALDLIVRAIAHWKLECDARNSENLWSIFEQRILTPTVTGQSPPSYADLLSASGFRSEKQAMNALTTATRAIRRHLVALLHQTHQTRLSQRHSPGDSHSDNLDDLQQRIDEAVQDDLNDIRNTLRGMQETDRSRTQRHVSTSCQEFIAAHLSRHGPAEMSAESLPLVPHPDEFDLRTLSSVMDDLSHDRRDFNLAELLREQLEIPLEFELAGRLDASRLRELASDSGLVIRSLSDLLHHSRPPYELLAMVRDFALAQHQAVDPVLPAEISSILYWLSIAAALVHLQVDLSDETASSRAHDGFSWAASQDWIDEELRGLLTTAIDRNQHRDHG